MISQSLGFFFDKRILRHGCGVWTLCRHIGQIDVDVILRKGLVKGPLHKRKPPPINHFPPPKRYLSPLCCTMKHYAALKRVRETPSGLIWGRLVNVNIKDKSFTIPKESPPRATWAIFFFWILVLKAKGSKITPCPHHFVATTSSGCGPKLKPMGDGKKTKYLRDPYHAVVGLYRLWPLPKEYGHLGWVPFCVFLFYSESSKMNFK